MSIPTPNAFQKYIDSDGRLTIEGIILLSQLVEKVIELEARIEALEP